MPTKASVSMCPRWPTGACTATLVPLVDEIRKHGFAAERIHADDTTVPVLARGKCRTGRLLASSFRRCRRRDTVVKRALDEATCIDVLNSQIRAGRAKITLS